MTRLVATGVTVERGRARLLDDAALLLGPGELLGIVGPNGAGKSTLLRCLAGLVRPERGEVTVDGRHVTALSGPERTRLIGYVPQSFTPAWDVSARDVVEMGAGGAGSPARAGSAARAGASAGIAAAIAAHELGALLDRRWSALSGGERARALLAAVLVATPPILLADEPGASLDIKHRLGLLARLRAYAETRAVAVVMHDLDLALRFCDRILVLDGGRVVLDAPRDEAAHHPALDAAFGIALRRIVVGEIVVALMPLSR